MSTEDRPRRFIPSEPVTSEERRALSVKVMDDFARRTGLTTGLEPVRYLWTDAFAVCNWLGIHEQGGAPGPLELATELVDQVHRVLGRHRHDDGRSGWISGLPEDEGARHPTAGGLRIGKAEPERGPDEPYDPGAEWDRDGQYYHYLTKWMHALHRMWQVTGERGYHRWAVELAEAAYAGFLRSSPGGPRLVWKMSVDLSRPLVPSSGHHDPLDGLLTASLLAASRPSDVDASVLGDEIRSLEGLCGGASWVTSDPLGVGGLLVDGRRCLQLVELGHPTGRRYLDSVLADGAASLRRLSGFAFLADPPQARLAFRELGLALGLRAVRGLADRPAADALDDGSLAVMMRSGPVADRILEVWSRPESRQTHTWLEHRDISEVTWVACLVPEGFLGR